MKDLLFLVHRIPYPPNKGDKIRSFHLLKYLSRHFVVHLGTFVDDPKDSEYVSHVKSFCGESFFAPLAPSKARIRSLTGLITGEALSLPYYKHEAMQAWVNEIIQERQIDHVVVFSSPMAQYVEGISMPHKVIDFVDVDSQKWAQYGKAKAWPMSWIYRREAEKLLQYESQLAMNSQASVFVSKDEAALFAGLVPSVAHKVTSINNGVDSDYFSPHREYTSPYVNKAPVVVFTGAMDYWANADAVRWFAQDIFPQIKAAVNDAEFYIVGSRPTSDVQSLAKLPGVTVTGGVPDIRPYLAHAKLAVAPMRIARGIQNKVLEALAMARPVLATSPAAEGLKVTAGQELLVADKPEAFADSAVRMLRGEVGVGLGEAGRECILAHYSWDTNLAQFMPLLNGTALADNAA